MILDTFNKEMCLFRLGRNDRYGRSFVFDLNLIPQRPNPKRLIFQWGGKRKTYQWSMSWRKFGKQMAIGTVACINRSEFKYSVRSPHRKLELKGKK